MLKNSPQKKWKRSRFGTYSGWKKSCTNWWFIPYIYTRIYIYIFISWYICITNPREDRVLKMYWYYPTIINRLSGGVLEANQQGCHHNLKPMTLGIRIRHFSSYSPQKKNWLNWLKFFRGSWLPYVHRMMGDFSKATSPGCTPAIKAGPPWATSVTILRAQVVDYNTRSGDSR